MPDLDAVADDIDAAFAQADTDTFAQFLAHDRSVGPTYVQCGTRDADRLFVDRGYGAFPAAGRHAAVPIRSVSKLFIAVAYLALVERRTELGHTLTLESTAGQYLGDQLSARCAGARVGARSGWRGATAAQLLTMTAPLDNSVNAAWRNLSHRGDHNGFPTACDSPDSPVQLGAMECVRELVLPVLDRQPLCAGRGLRGARRGALARRLATRLVRTIESAPDATCTDDWTTACCPWAEAGECSRNPVWMHEHCPAACAVCVPAGAADSRDFRGCLVEPAADTCADVFADCAARRALGHCEGAAAYTRRAACRATCGVCTAAAPVAAERPAQAGGGSMADSLWSALGALGTALGVRASPPPPPPPPLVPPPQRAPRGSPTPEFIFEYDRPAKPGAPRPGGRTQLMRRRTRNPSVRRKCVYDNWSYTLLDALVHRATGRRVLWWVSELVLKPLNLSDALHCTGLERAPGNGSAARPETRCFDKAPFAPPLGAWPPREPGEYTDIWVSNTIVASAHDLSVLCRLLLNGGSLGGVRVLSEASVDALFDSARLLARGSSVHDPTPPPGGAWQPNWCMGMSSFGMGLGWCAEDSPGQPFDLCNAPDWYGWAGSYGARVMLLRDRGVFCAWTSNIPRGNDRKGARLQGRHHHVGHRISVVLRRAWPPLDPLPLPKPFRPFPAPSMVPPQARHAQQRAGQQQQQRQSGRRDSPGAGADADANDKSSRRRGGGDGQPSSRRTT